MRSPGFWLLMLPLVLIGAGCCATGSVWAWADDDPCAIEEAWLAGGTLHVAIRYQEGRLRRFEREGRSLREVSDPPAGPRERVATFDSVAVAAPSAEKRDGRKLDVSLYPPVQRGERRWLRVREGRKESWYELPVPIAWSTARPYAALLLTPLTLAVDLAAAPIHVAWILATAGGHGDPWLPWCDR